LGGDTVLNGQISFKVLILPCCDTPEFQKGCGHTLHGVTFQPDTGILPVSVGTCQIKVFVRKIVAAGKCDLSVDDGDFPVIPMVHEQVKDRHSRIEYPALDALTVQFSCKFQIHIADAAEIVVHQPHFHTGLRLPDENFTNFLKSFPIVHNEVFHEDEIFRLFQRFQHIFQCLRCLRIIGDGST
jgi:hypothetical protein